MKIHNYENKLTDKQKRTKEEYKKGLEYYKEVSKKK